VVVTGMFLTVPYDVGFGKETLGEKFILMGPEKEEEGDAEMNLGRSLAPLTELVKRVVGWEEGTNEKKENGDEIVED
jgi:hypothetical protein